MDLARLALFSDYGDDRVSIDSAHFATFRTFDGDGVRQLVLRCGLCDDRYLDATLALPAGYRPRHRAYSASHPL